MATVALEARSLSTLGGGVRTYTQEVIKRILSTDKKNKYSVYYDSNKYLGTFSGATERVVNLTNPFLRIYWDYFSLPKAFLEDNIEFVHYFKPATTPFKKPVAIATIYDVIPLLFPNTQTFTQLLYWKKQLPLVARTCRHIITISECSKRDIVEKLQIPPDKITVTPLGVNRIFEPTPDDLKKEARVKYTLPEKFILYTGTIEPRKNIANLVRSFNILAKNFPHDLVIAGKWGWEFGDVKREIGKSEFRERIRVLSYVEQKYLPALYGCASVFVFPSIYEGFGLPPLEAMACGTPVAVSNVSSLPEVVGDAALLFDPHDPDSIVSALAKILSDRKKAEGLSELGIERAKIFSWDKTAEITLDVYRKNFVN